MPPVQGGGWLILDDFGAVLLATGVFAFKLAKQPRDRTLAAFEVHGIKPLAVSPSINISATDAASKNKHS